MKNSIYMDMGNTRIKWWHCATDTYGVLEYVNLEVGSVSLKQQSAQIDGVVIASVLGLEKTRMVVELIKRYVHPQVKLCVVGREAVGVTCAYDDPGRLGIDRWLAVIAVWQQYRKACQVVDLGTALTIDQIDSDGKHLGGFIVSGLELSVRGLLGGTKNIKPDSKLMAEANLNPGVNTAEAVYHGALLAAVSIIETSYTNATRLDKDTKLILVGGDAALVGPHLRCDYRLVGDLVFQGMKLLEDADLLIDAADAL